MTLLREANKQVNLISRKDEENIWGRHILHAVALLFKIDIPPNARVLDLGTGGGLPGIPIKIARPDLGLTLLDSTRKKTDAVKNICAEIGLRDTRVVWGRAEEVGLEPDHHHQYDLVLARAVAELADLATWSAAFLRASNLAARLKDRGGEVRLPALIAYKGGELDREISRLKRKKTVGHIEVISLDGISEELHDKKLVIISTL